MSYDGRLMRQALARFDEDKQRRAENFRARERAIYTKCPRIEEIDRELSHTMAKIIASGLRRGTDRARRSRRCGRKTSICSRKSASS